MDEPVTAMNGLEALVQGKVLSAFTRLRRLVDHIPPGHAKPIIMTAGDPKEVMPGFVVDRMAEAKSLLGTYPQIRGSDELRGAIATWITRRYGIKGQGWFLAVHAFNQSITNADFGFNATLYTYITDPRIRPDRDPDQMSDPVLSEEKFGGIVLEVTDMHDDPDGGFVGGIGSDRGCRRLVSGRHASQIEIHLRKSKGMLLLQDRDEFHQLSLRFLEGIVRLVIPDQRPHVGHLDGEQSTPAQRTDVPLDGKPSLLLLRHLLPCSSDRYGLCGIGGPLGRMPAL